MPTKSTKTQLSIIDDSLMGEFQINAFDERKYNAIFYSIKDIHYLESKRMLGEAFDKDAFKIQFELTFGKAEDKRYTIEQLLAFAKEKFNLGMEELLLYNKKSWQRREQRQKQYAEAELVEQEIPF
ncbi:MAG: hypothetical protein KME31_05095 [Tolypothrix carrinoi HA7290-LM1]|jgi:hypothetical protein|nr:hypothetical protein [Tolypothrix carrinoi HA7290-LM1]